MTYSQKEYFDYLEEIDSQNDNDNDCDNDYDENDYGWDSYSNYYDDD